MKRHDHDHDHNDSDFIVDEAEVGEFDSRPLTPAPNIEHQESSPPQAQSPTTQPRIFKALPHQRRRIGHPLSWSAGFSDNAMFQRSASDGVAVYGFADSSASVSVKVEGTTATGCIV